MAGYSVEDWSEDDAADLTQPPPSVAEELAEMNQHLSRIANNVSTILVLYVLGIIASLVGGFFFIVMGLA